MTELPPRPARARWLLLGAGLLLGVLIGLFLLDDLPALPWAAAAPAGTPGTPAPAAVAGAPAPEFTLTDTAGQAISLASLKGQVVLINFWATWCAPCQFEMPAIQREFERRQDQGFTVLAVDAAEQEAEVSDFGGKFGLGFPLLLDPDAAVNDLYRVRGYPTTFFVDRTGMIAVEHVGVMTDAQLADYLTQLDLKE